jgi:hypothetical protein
MRKPFKNSSNEKKLSPFFGGWTPFFLRKGSKSEPKRGFSRALAL